VRPRLIRQLADRFRTVGVVVVAPAGFGKTTLLAQAVQENRLAPHGIDYWLTCTADDAAASSLAEGLCQAMDLASAPHPEDAAVAVIEAIWHRSPAEVALVLDDVHDIPAGSSGAQFLSRLIAELPQNGHVVLAGRQPPPVALSRREVHGEVLRIDETALLFTPDELEEFAAERSVPAHQLADSGGWPALAELAASTRIGVDAAFLWEEVLATIDAEQRRALALLAHIGSFDEALAQAAVDDDVDIKALTADLPLIATAIGGEIQIHPLWRPHLDREVSDDDIAAARRRVGRERARRGDLAGAVRLLAEAAAWDDVTEVVAESLGAAHPPIPGNIVATWLGHLPEAMEGSALARLLGAAAAVESDPALATRELEAAAAAFRSEGNASGELACMAQLAQVAWWTEQPETLMALAARLFEIEALGDQKVVPLACLGRALIADVAGDCELELAELARIAPGSVHPTTQALVDWLRSTTLHHLGRPAEALEAARRALVNAAPLHAPVIECASLQALWFLGHVEEVVERFPTLVELTASSGLRDYTALVAEACSSAYAVTGRVEEAATYLERARGAAASPALALVDVNLVVAEAVLQVARGDEAGAARILGTYLERWPNFGAGLPAFPQRRTLTLWYVLIPKTREFWDTIDLGPVFATARDLARTLVTVRADARLDASSPELPAPGVVRALVPLPWATEIAVAYIGAGRKSGWDLLEALWPQAQADVRRLSHHTTGSLGRAARTALARLPVPPSGAVELNLLGPFELRRDGRAVDAPEWRRERVRHLLAHLAFHRPVSRERLAADLWPSLDADAQAGNLRVTLTHLLRVVEPERADRDASFLIRPHGGGLLLHRGEWFRTDVWEFDDCWREAIEADRDGLPSKALRAMQRAVALWREDPSELAVEDWALPEVEERRQRLVSLAVRAGELLVARGDHEPARQMGEIALRTDPWSERAYKVVLTAQLATSDHSAARRTLERCRTALAEIGLDTGDTIRQMETLLTPRH
jgi:DNA-binding SARP family transcriptional activator